MYSLSAYCSFIADGIRTDAYVKALRQAVKPGCVVLDIGAGTGFFAVLACRLGARKAYAVEYNNAIRLGPELAAANGCDGQVEFIQEMSTKVTLPERADIIISDLRGTMPLLAYSVTSIVDARERLLAPDGVLIPARDRLWAAIVESPAGYEKNIASLTNPRYDLNLEASRRFLVNQLWRVRAEHEQLLVEPRVWAVLEYATIDSPDLEAELNWKAERAGTAHGISLWFEAELGPDARYSTAPFEPELVYGNPFLHFQSPVEIVAGDTISVKLQAKLVDDEYIWRWDTLILDQGKRERIKADFRQSTFFGEILSPAELRKKAADFVPALNEDGQIESYVLSLMSGEVSVGEIAAKLSDRFPQRFPTWARAMRHAGELSKKFSR